MAWILLVVWHSRCGVSERCFGGEQLFVVLQDASFEVAIAGVLEGNSCLLYCRMPALKWPWTWRTKMLRALSISGWARLASFPSTVWLPLSWQNLLIQIQSPHQSISVATSPTKPPRSRGPIGTFSAQHFQTYSSVRNSSVNTIR